jgi:methionyl-tRNA formyltransferase
LRVVFAGTPQFARPALEALLEHHEVTGVVTQPDRPRGRGRALAASPVKELAKARGLALAQPPALRGDALLARLAAWRPDVMVVVAYGLLLPPAVLALPRYGCLNIHASLLPRWRGAAPIQRAILAGDRTTGVTIMRMDEGLDTGPMLLKEELPIAPEDTSGSLAESLARLGSAALIRALAGLAAGTLDSRPQPSTGVTHAPKIGKAEGRIDWSRSAVEIERQVRAFNPWPVAETALDGVRLRVYSAAVASDPESAPKIPLSGTIIAVRGGNLMVRCGQGCLEVREVQKPGGKVMPVRDFAHNLALPGRRLG